MIPHYEHFSEWGRGRDKLLDQLHLFYPKHIVQAIPVDNVNTVLADFALIIELVF